MDSNDKFIICLGIVSLVGMAGMFISYFMGRV